jgi:methylmalonyl-CoA mutase N-terminal domain/subunit
VPAEQLQGTVQNDILKEYIARGTYIYPPGPSLRLVADTFRFTAERMPKFNPISVSGYHMREAGATAAQEVGFTFANGLEYVRRAIAAGLDVEALAPRLSFFFAAYTDLFEEVAKFRAARRLWARLMKERFNASESACRLRFHTQTGGATLTAQQPVNNVARVAIQALAAVLGGTQSLHTNSFDEALALPTEQSATLALRTQQILASETGVPEVVDPFGGSWYVEELTDRIELEARRYIEDVERLGGAVQAIERGFFQEAIARSAYEYQQRAESGEATVVGVNKFATEDPVPVTPVPDYSALETEQRRRVAEVRTGRDQQQLERVLTRLEEAARKEAEPLLPAIVDCIRARASVGEVSTVFRSLWGTHDKQRLSRS